MRHTFAILILLASATLAVAGPASSSQWTETPCEAPSLVYPAGVALGTIDPTGFQDAYAIDLAAGDTLTAAVMTGQQPPPYDQAPQVPEDLPSEPTAFRLELHDETCGTDPLDDNLVSYTAPESGTYILVVKADTDRSPDYTLAYGVVPGAPSS